MQETARIVLDPAIVSLNAHLTVGRERRRRGASHHTEQILQQCASWLTDSMAMQRQLHNITVGLLNYQAEHDKQFEDSLLVAMSMKAQEDRKLMAMALETSCSSFRNHSLHP